MVGHLADNTADDRHLVGDAGNLRQIVAEDITLFGFDNAERTPVLDRSLGLRVKRFVVGKATGQVQLDDAASLRRDRPTAAGSGKGVCGGFGSRRLEPQHIGE